MKNGHPDRKTEENLNLEKPKIKSQLKIKMKIKHLIRNKRIKQIERNL